MGKHILKNRILQMEFLTDALRIIGLAPAGKRNILAGLSNSPSIPTPYGDFHFHGGHRLWHSPESMPRTYIPDSPVTITELTDGVLLEAQTEPSTRIRKRIEIYPAPDKPSVRLIHTLINDGMWSVELAPWAITQFRLGGVGVLPMPVGNIDSEGLLPNRQLSFWPYASVNDSRLRLSDEYILFIADALPPFKIGYFNTHGWMAYWLEGVLFRKTFELQEKSTYPDNNSNSELYCNELFFELESLAPLVKLEPGNSVNHVEVWDIYYGLETLPHEIREVIHAI